MSRRRLYPLRFEPIYQYRPWGWATFGGPSEFTSAGRSNPTGICDTAAGDASYRASWSTSTSAVLHPLSQARGSASPAQGCFRSVERYPVPGNGSSWRGTTSPTVWTGNTSIFTTSRMAGWKSAGKAARFPTASSARPAYQSCRHRREQAPRSCLVNHQGTTGSWKSPSAAISHIPIARRLRRMY